MVRVLQLLLIYWDWDTRQFKRLAFQFLSQKMGKIGPNVPEIGSIGGRNRICRGFSADLGNFKPEKRVGTAKCFEVEILLENSFNLADASA